MSDAKPRRMGYNITLTPRDGLSIAETSLTFRADVVAKGGRTLERTVIARGRARDAIVDAVRVGERITIRGLYQKAANDDAPDGRGGEYIVALCLPRIDLRKRPRRAA